MKNMIGEMKDFTFKFHKILNTPNVDDDVLIYLLSYLYYAFSIIENDDRPLRDYINSGLEVKHYSFDSLVDYFKQKFAVISSSENFDNYYYEKVNKYIVEALDYISNYNLDLNVNDLVELLSTYNVEFYKNFLVVFFTNEFHKNLLVNRDKTPDELVDLYKYFVEYANYLDIGCGDGSTLFRLSYDANQYVRAHGIDINPNKSLIAKLRLSMCEILNDSRIDVVCDDLFTTRRLAGDYSFITINMPFGMRIPPQKRFEVELDSKNNYFSWDVNPNVSSEWLYVNKALKLLNCMGRIVLVTPRIPLLKTADIKYRKDLIDNNLVEYVINMPDYTYPDTRVSYSLIVLNKNKKDNFVKFLNASDCYKSTTNHYVRIIDSERIKMLLEDETQIINISNNQIKDKDYSLSLDNYVAMTEKFKMKDAVPLSELNIEISRGYQTFSKEDIKQNGKYSIVTVSDIDDCGELIEDLGTFDNDKELDKYLLKENDILISTKGTRLKICMIDKLKKSNTIYHGNLSLIRVKDNRLNPAYLKLFLESERGQIELKSIQTGMSIISINSTQLSKINVPLLSREEQDQIVEKYSSIKREINYLTNRLNLLKDNLSDSLNEFFEGVKE